MKTILLSTAVALIAASAASAQTTEGQFNLSAGYTYLDVDGVEFDTLTLRGGYDFTPYVGVEGEVLIGLGDEDLGGGFDASYNYGLGAFVKGQYPVTEQISLFGRVGYVWAEVEASGLGATVTDEEDGVGYGVGAEYALNGLNALRADYTRYDFGDDSEADGFSVAYVRRF